jgi:hypothetical protein
MSEQKRIGKELDYVVAERARELAEANEALKKDSSQTGRSKTAGE